MSVFVWVMVIKKQNVQLSLKHENLSYSGSMLTRILKVEKRREEKEEEEILIRSEDRLVLTVETLTAQTSTVQTLTLTRRKYLILRAENSNKKDINTENIEDEKDETRSKQLQGAGLVNLKSVNQAEFTGDPVNLVLGDSNATRVQFKDPDVYYISQPGVAVAGFGSLLSRMKTKTINTMNTATKSVNEW